MSAEVQPLANARAGCVSAALDERRHPDLMVRLMNRRCLRLLARRTQYGYT
jgi:hypothetical protein